MTTLEGQPNGVVAVLEDTGYEFRSWLYPGNVVTMVDGEARYQARVTDRAHESSSDAARATIEIPDFLPEDLDAWRDVVVEWEGQGRINATVVEARLARLPPCLEPSIADSARVRLFKREIVGRAEVPFVSHGELLRLAGDGGALGRRDRILCEDVLEGRSERSIDTAVAVLNGVLAGIAFDGDGEGGVYDDLATMLASSSTWFETPCSGIWKNASRLFPWLAGGGSVGPSCARSHLRGLFRACGIESAPSPWTPSRVYTLDDLASEGEGAREFALEAFLYRWRFDKPAENVLRTNGGKEEEGRIADDPAAVATTVDAGADFAVAVARAREAVRVVASRLQERLDQARRFAPRERADQDALVHAVEEAAALGIEIEVDGQKVSKLLVQRGTTLTWQLSDGSRGFRKHPAIVDVVRLSAPQRIPEP